MGGTNYVVKCHYTIANGVRNAILTLNHVFKGRKKIKAFLSLGIAICLWTNQ